MKNCIVLGCARSGTSAVTGAIAASKYIMLSPHSERGDERNPKGWYESRTIIDINDSILQNLCKCHNIVKPDFDDSWWLAQVPLEADVKGDVCINRRIQDATSRRPFLFKDPRFSYTLPSWQHALEDTIIVCMFRSPADTVLSIKKFLGQRFLTVDYLFKTWELMYQHILKSDNGALFIHFDQILFGDGLNRLVQATGATVDHKFPEAKLRRSVSTLPIPEKSHEIYQELCRRADYNRAK